MAEPSVYALDYLPNNPTPSEKSLCCCAEKADITSRMRQVKGKLLQVGLTQPCSVARCAPYEIRVPYVFAMVQRKAARPPSLSLSLSPEKQKRKKLSNAKRVFELLHNLVVGTTAARNTKA